MKEKKEIKFKLEAIDKKDIPDSLKIKPVKINKVKIPKITPIKNISGYRFNKLENKHIKVDETEIEYLKNLNYKPIKAYYIQEIYNRLKKEKEK